MSSRQKRQSERFPWPESALICEDGGSLSDYATEIRKLLFRSAAFRRAGHTVVEHGLGIGGSDKASLDDQKFIKHISSIGLGACPWADQRYAVGNLYRHHIELLLKVVILLGRRLAGEESSFPRTHSLERLWGEARYAIENNIGHSIKISLDDADQRIRKLAQVEAKTQELRYPSSGDEFDKFPATTEELRDLACPLGDFLAECAESLWQQRFKQRRDN
jgi:hypothetical protein